MGAFVRFILAIVVLTVAGTQVYAQSMRNMSVLTGQKSGTYYRFGQDIATVIEQECGSKLDVKESKGSIENFDRLRHEKYSQLAIVQEDALTYLRRSDDTDIKEWADKFKYVFPLYLEEVHIVARRDSNIKTFEDLSGRRIAIGEPQSGTNLTAALTFLHARVTGETTDIVEIGGDEAFERLFSNDPAQRIDAMFYVAGKPIKLLSGDDPRLSELTLVSITTPDIVNNYTPVTIKRSDYKWLDHDVDTVAVRSVLISFDFQQSQCDNIGMVANRLVANIEELREKIGHPKWKQVDLNAPLKGWERYSCAVKGLERQVISTGEQKCAFAATVSNGSPSKGTPPVQEENSCRKKCMINGAVNKLCELVCAEKQQLKIK
jgi:TRAP transporter TAXI family solute receptor